LGSSIDHLDWNRSFGLLFGNIVHFVPVVLDWLVLVLLWNWWWFGLRTRLGPCPVWM